MIMPASPAQVRAMAEEVRAIYQAAENRILRVIAAQVARGVEGPTWAERRIDALSTLTRQIDAIVKDLRDNVPGAVERAVAFSYRRGIATAAAELEKAGVHDPFQGSGLHDAILALTSEAMAPHEQAQQGIRRVARDIYERATMKAAGTVLTGTTTRQEAAQQAIKELVGQGVKGFTDRSGRKWDLASYAEMATRTVAAQSTIQGHSDKLQDYGKDLVIISDSDEECARCRPFEGKILSLSGQNAGKKLSDGHTVLCSLREARSKGLFHPNCTHQQVLYTPGLTRVPKHTANPEGYKLREKQRAWERRIRELKREVIATEEGRGKNDPIAKQARQKLRSAQAEFKAWRTEFDRKNLSYRTNPNHH